MAAPDGQRARRAGRRDVEPLRRSSRSPATPLAYRSPRCRASRIPWPTSRSWCRRPEPGATSRVVPGQRARGTTRVGAVGVRVHGRGGLAGGDHGGTRAGRPRRIRRSCVLGLSGAGQGLAVGRRRSGCHRQVRRRHRRRARNAVQGRANRWSSPASSCRPRIGPSRTTFAAFWAASSPTK